MTLGATCSKDAVVKQVHNLDQSASYTWYKACVLAGTSVESKTTPLPSIGALTDQHHHMYPKQRRS
eukprot:5995371-Amphidinium_carterae.1